LSQVLYRFFFDISALFVVFIGFHSYDFRECRLLMKTSGESLENGG